MNIPKHVLNCPWVGQQHDILSFCEHLILILRLSSILSQNDNSDLSYLPLTHRHDRFFEKLRQVFYQIRLWCAGGDVLGFWRHQCVCVEGIDTRDSRASSKAKKAPNLFFFLLPPFLLPYDDGLFFSSYSISLFGLSSFMSLDRLHSLRGSGFTISFCMGGNDKIIQGRIG